MATSALLIILPSPRAKHRDLLYRIMATLDRIMDTKVQTWRDDLRLPCIVDPNDTSSIISELDILRKPPPPFQSKHLPALKRNKWFILKRGRDRRGLVVIWPERQCCVYISGDAPGKRQGPRVALLRIRVDPTFLAEGVGLTVFAATLSAESRTLAIEDTLIWKGRATFPEETFTKRWQRVVRWIEHYCILDARLLSGLEIRAATWESLSVLRPSGTWFLQSDDMGHTPLVWSVHHKELVPSPPRVRNVVLTNIEQSVQEHQENQENQENQKNQESQVKAPVIDNGPIVAVATRDTGPEQWVLTTSDNVSLGRALIRRLAVSTAMRSAKANTVRVQVEWVPSFKKWEICRITDLPARSSASFLPA